MGTEHDPGRRELLTRFEPLWADAQHLWDRHAEDMGFEQYVSADYRAVFDSLAGLQGQVQQVLEWGSGLGVVTIMASEMGFDAYGIEAEPKLVAYSEELADRYGRRAIFGTGSFIPDEFAWSPECEDEASRTMLLDGVAAYAELDMELRDFDLIYAYPWPDEHTLYRTIMRKCAAPQAILLTYDGREGMEVWRQPA